MVYLDYIVEVEVEVEVGGGARGGAPAITPTRGDTFPPTPEAELSLTIQLSLFFNLYQLYFLV